MKNIKRVECSDWAMDLDCRHRMCLECFLYNRLESCSILRVKYNLSDEYYVCPGVYHYERYY